MYRFRIYPNKSQKELFARTFGCVRFVYNRMLAEKKEYYEKTGKVLKVTPAKYKAEFPWLKEVDSLALCNAQLHLQTAYKNFFRDSSAGFPKFKSKKNPVRSYTTNCVNGNITLQNAKLKLPKAGWIRIKQHRSIDDRYILKGATVNQEADDKYYVSLLYAAQEPEHEIRPVKTAIGIPMELMQIILIFPKIPGKTCKGAAQAESLRKGERPLHETEKENSQTPCSYRTSAERLSTQGIQKDNQFLRSCVHRIFEHERNEPGFKVWNECS